MKLWVLTLILNGHTINHRYKFYYKKTCDTIGKSFIDKRRLNKYRCNLKIIGKSLK